jgi:Ca2+-binding EF-hand superfamily protein
LGKFDNQHREGGNIIHSTSSFGPPSRPGKNRFGHPDCIMSNQYDQASTNYKEAFSLFDKRGNGRVALDSLGDLLRACGQNPTLSEIRDLEKTVGGDCMSFPSAVCSILAPPS